MADTRLFRITYAWEPPKYGERKVLGPAVAYYNKTGGGYRKGCIEKIEATNAEATSGWADVTEEFLAR